MKASEIKVGAAYLAKVSGKVVPVRVLERFERFTAKACRTHWRCRNEVTGRVIEVKSPQRFRSEVPPPVVRCVHLWGVRDAERTGRPGKVEGSEVVVQTCKRCGERREAAMDSGLLAGVFDPCAPGKG